jgi:hypothetical protein
MRVLKNKTIILILSLFCWTAKAQSDKPTILPIMIEGATKLDAIEKAGNTIVRMEYDIVAKGASKTTFRKLYPNHTYTILSFGAESRIRDIDVKLYKKVKDTWEIAIQDTRASPEAVLEFTPTDLAYYKIEISVYSFKSGFEVGHYGLIVYHE